MNTEQIEDIYPLAPMQQGILYHTLYAPESGVYLVQVVWTLRGDLNAAAFEQAAGGNADSAPLRDDFRGGRTVRVLAQEL